jgi:hypothetical protein
MLFFWHDGTSLESMVELVGIEPSTSSLRTMASAKLSCCSACTWQPRTPIQNSRLAGSLPQHFPGARIIHANHNYGVSLNTVPLPETPPLKVVP